MQRVSKLRAEIISQIETFLDSHGIKCLTAAEVNEGSSPIIIDGLDDEDTFTLDRLINDEVDTILECSSCWENTSVSLYDVNAEVAEGILDWLYENEEEISEIVKEEE